MRRFALVLMLLSGLVTTATPLQAQAARPNIIFFLVDDLSADLLKYMDNTRSLANNGTRFTNYFVSNSLCCPSRASMFTGEHPHNTGVLTNVGTDNGGYAAFERHEDRTYAAALHRQNYRTGYLGKYINEYPVGENFKVPQGWDEWHVAGGGGYNELKYSITDYVRETGVKRLQPGQDVYLTDRLARTAEDFLDRSRRQAPNSPFFLQVAPFAPHARVPFQPGEGEPRFPPAPRDRPGGEFPQGDCGGPSCPSIDVAQELPSFDEDTADKPGWVRRDPLGPGITDELRQDFRNRIRMVQSVDDLVGRVLAKLTPAERDDTFIVFGSDNGFHLGQHRLIRGKGTAYDHDVNVPLLVKRPGRTGNGDFVRDEIVQNVDLFATFLDMAGANPPDRDGRSLLPLIRNQNQPNWRNAALVEHRKPQASADDPDFEDLAAGPPSYKAVRTRDDLYVEYANGEKEYYDLKVDPLQQNNKPNAPRAGQLAGPLRELASCAQNCWAAAHVQGG
ncbi:sulfatase [Lentzea sp. NPDC051838]|uniref:sulfatase family protein n=1 Tax=Lentzea sp. NPDC051838 TaxID=3154849 RepID=UPI003444B9C9